MTDEQILSLRIMLANIQAGRFKECIQLGENILREDPGCLGAHELLGYAFGGLTKWTKAAEHLQIVFNSGRLDSNFVCNLASAYVNSGSPEIALNVLSSLPLPIDPEAVYSTALAHSHLGNWSLAVSTLRGIFSQNAQQEHHIILMAKSLNAIRDHKNALSCLVESGCRISVDFLVEKAAALVGLTRFDEATVLYKSVLELNPNHQDAMAALADLHERANDLDSVSILFENLNWANVSHPRLLFVGARFFRRSNDRDTAINLLQRAESNCRDALLLAAICFEKGRQLDELQRYESAYESFVYANSLTLGEFKRRFPSRNASLSDLTWLTGAPLSNNHYQFEPVSTCDNRKDPIFVVGFPRSGTTLLEQLLAAHPDLVCMEERPCLAASQDVYLKRFRNVPLEALTQCDIDELRGVYFSEVMKEGVEIADRRLVDKHPFNITRVGYIKRIFPTAKVIFALRHPCDAILSCFMQNFVVNDGTVGFHSLQSSAEIYAATMDKWLREKDSACPSYFIVKYEDMVNDIFGMAENLVSFLGLDWSDEFLSYVDKAKSKARINTPSYHQVVRPVYQSSVYRWRNYQEKFIPVLPIVQRYIDSFGYGDV